MHTWLLHTADITFVVFHAALTLFNALGWSMRRTRRWHLLTMFLTGVSWVGLGYFHGWGYCVCTEWHWQVREALQQPIPFDSYITFLVYHLTGVTCDEQVVAHATLAVYLTSWLLTITLNLRDWRHGARRR